MVRLSKSVKDHNREVKRVQGIISRLTKSGDFSVNIDISSLSTRKLKNVHKGLDLVRKGYAIRTDAWYERKRKEEEERIEREEQRRIDRRERAIERRVDKKYKYADKRHKDDPIRFVGPVVNIMDEVEATGGASDFKNDGTNITKFKIYSGSSASVQIDMLMAIAEYGKQYTGMKVNKDAVEFVNEKGKVIYNMIDEARRKFGDEELVKRIEESEWGSVKQMAKTIERMILSIYDRNYFEGSEFGSTVDEDMIDLEMVLWGEML